MEKHKKLDNSYQKESSSVIVFLQELVLSFRSFISNLLGIDPGILPSFFFCHVSNAFHLKTFFLQTEKDKSICF